MGLGFAFKASAIIEGYRPEMVKDPLVLMAAAMFMRTMLLPQALGEYLPFGETQRAHGLVPIWARLHVKWQQLRITKESLML